MNALTCSYCGGQIPATQAFCPGCGTQATLPPLPSVPASEPVAVSAEASQVPFWSEKRLRAFELLIVCAIAFGTSIITSFVYLQAYVLGHRTPRPTQGNVYWVNISVKEASVLALVWYLLQRRSLRFRDLGLNWSAREIGFGVLLFIGASLARGIVAGLIHGMTGALHMSLGAEPDVGRFLFGGSVLPLAILFQFLNPFFEELIVRAYLMTELQALKGGVGLAVFASVAIQTSYHFYQGVSPAFAHAGFFLVLALYYAKTKRIGAPIVAHLFGDVLPTVMYMFRTGQM